MIMIHFYHDTEKVGSKTFSIQPTEKWKKQLSEWIAEGRIKPDNAGFNRFEFG